MELTIEDLELIEPVINQFEPVVSWQDPECDVCFEGELLELLSNQVTKMELRVYMEANCFKSDIIDGEMVYLVKRLA